MLGNEIIFHDIDKKKLATLKGRGYRVTRDILEAIKDSSVSFVCVPTPTVNGKVDLSYVKRATIDVAQSLREKEEYHVVVFRSTVLPSTTSAISIPLLEKHSKKIAGEDFGVCTNPEFLRQATAIQDFLDPHRIVIGELDKRSGDLLEKLYTPFEIPIVRTGLVTAEMIKYVSNCFLATKISFFNEISIICKRLGLEPHFISEVVSLDPRIGEYGIYGGRPFEGNCLPKDLQAFISFVEEKKLNPKILTATLHINEEIAKMHANGENP